MSTDTIGASADFATIALWSADVKGIGTLTENEVGELIDDVVYARGAQSDLDFNAVTLAGFTITLRGVGSGINDGDFGSGARIEAAVAFGGLYQARKLILEDFSVNNTETTSGGARCFVNSTDTKFSRVIAKTDSTGGNSDVFELGVGVVVEVCRAVGGTIGFDLGNAGISVNNCTALNATIGFNSPTANTSTSKNNVAFNCGTDWSGTYSGTYTNNASEDGTHPGTSGVTISGDPFDVDGFTPASSGQLDGAGVDLGITLDAANNNYNATPSIGAYESIGAAPSGGNLLLTNRSIANFQGMRQ